MSSLLARARPALAPLSHAVVEALYPPLCVNCRAEVEEAHALCPDCWRDTGFIGRPICLRCGAPVPGAEDADLCDHCLGRDLAFDRARAAVLYDGIGRRLALSFKHGDRLEIARPASAWMVRAGRDLLDGAEMIVPAPLHWTRLLRRRFNQAAELARRIAARAETPFAPDALRRIRRTPPQGGLGRAEREANLAGAFAVPPARRAAIAGKRVLLVDDVYTTGATLCACAAALRAGGARRVDALCFARVASEGGATISSVSSEDSGT